MLVPMAVLMPRSSRPFLIWVKPIIKEALGGQTGRTPCAGAVRQVCFREYEHSARTSLSYALAARIDVGRKGAGIFNKGSEG